MNRESKVLVFLTVWLIANFIPHLVVFLTTGKIYYQLPAVWMIVAESSIMLLNLLLPVFALRYIFKQTSGILSNLGWQWNGRRTVQKKLLASTITLLSGFLKSDRISTWLRQNQCFIRSI